MASGSGTVVLAKWCGGGGNCVKIKHNSTYETVYAHMKAFARGIKSGKKVVGTYYFNTERSSASNIVGRSDKVPGKWRSCEIKVPKGKQTYSVEVSDREKTVLTRFILY